MTAAAFPPLPRRQSPNEGDHVWSEVPGDAKLSMCHRCAAPVWLVPVTPGGPTIRVSADVDGGYPPVTGTPGRGKVHIVVCSGRRSR